MADSTSKKATEGVTGSSGPYTVFVSYLAGNSIAPAVPALVEMLRAIGSHTTHIPVIGSVPSVFLNPELLHFSGYRRLPEPLHLFPQGSYPRSLEHPSLLIRDSLDVPYYFPASDLPEAEAAPRTAEDDDDDDAAGVQWWLAAEMWRSVTRESETLKASLARLTKVLEGAPI